MAAVGGSVRGAEKGMPQMFKDALKLWYTFSSRLLFGVPTIQIKLLFARYCFLLKNLKGFKNNSCSVSLHADKFNFVIYIIQ